jgi:DNA-binding CsgD family transcriptional regulator
VVVRPVTENFGLLGTLRRSVEVEILDQAQAAGRLDVIQSLFELTGRELQVLRLLGQGHSIDSLSAMIEISRNTTRAHLRSIFSKTRTNSQTELLQLCGSLSNVAAPDWQSADLAAVN